MSDKELIKKLLYYYKSVVEEVTISPVWRETLEKLHVDSGVCETALQVFHVNLYYPTPDWISRNYKSKKSGAWAVIPKFASNKENAIKLLKIRVDILEKEHGRLHNEMYLHNKLIKQASDSGVAFTPDSQFQMGIDNHIDQYD